MPAKLRLQRFGKKGFAFYHIVVADARAPRDGKFIEKLGLYNPNSNPATIELNNDKALQWLQNGAQPTETVRAILSYKGVLYRKHLNDGVKKGAMTQEAADAKFEAWLGQKSGKIENKKSSLATKKADDLKARMTAETKVKEERLKRIADAANAATTNDAPAAEETTDTPAAE